MTQDASSSDSSGSIPRGPAIEVPRLLIVEDNDDLRREFAAYFASHGYLVTATRTLGAAVTLADAHRPHAVITELMLPDVRGYRFVDTLRRAVPDHRLRVIAVTRMPDILFQRARESGFDEVLAKPVDLAVLRGHLER